jgi:hypothetical protein
MMPPMAEIAPEIAAQHPPTRPMIAARVAIALALTGAILGGTVLLWAHYGTTVFFETIRAGFSACFG